MKSLGYSKEEREEYFLLSFMILLLHNYFPSSFKQDGQNFLYPFFLFFFPVKFVILSLCDHLLKLEPLDTVGILYGDCWPMTPIIMLFRDEINSL